MCKKNSGVDAQIYTAGKGSLTDKDVTIFNTQYPKLIVKSMFGFHDRFLIIDDTEIYLLGASIKDAGKKSLGIVKIESKDIIRGLIEKVSRMNDE